MTPPLFWRCLNAIRRSLEDHRAGDVHRFAQMRQLVARSQKRKAEVLNLQQYRDARRNVFQTSLRRVS